MEKTGKSNTFNTREVIFPVFICNLKDEGAKPKEYLGTAFFVEINKKVYLITAKHVLNINTNRVGKNEHIGFGSLADRMIYPVGSYDTIDNCDIAYKLFTKESLPESIKPLKIISDSGLLHQGQNVSSFGFPFSQITKDRTHLEEISFSGIISTIYTSVQLKSLVQEPFDTNYALDFECPRGLSGAPLLIKSGTSFLIAGMLYGNKKISFLTDTQEIITSGKETRIIESHKINYFGLASTHKIFLEIAKKSSKT